MTRGLLASALLRSLQHTRFQIATENCFVYSQGVADSKTDETCAGELRFLMDKIKKDARHEIIPHVLGTHILSLLAQGGRSPAPRQGRARRRDLLAGPAAAAAGGPARRAGARRVRVPARPRDVHGVRARGDERAHARPAVRVTLCYE